MSLKSLSARDYNQSAADNILIAMSRLESPFIENKPLTLGYLPRCRRPMLNGNCLVDGLRAFVLYDAWSNLDVYDLLAETMR